MSKLSELIDYIHSHPIEHEKEWEILRDRIMLQSHDASSIRELDKDVKDFFVSPVPEKDKEKLRGYTECLAILIDAVNEGMIK